MVWVGLGANKIKHKPKLPSLAMASASDLLVALTMASCLSTSSCDTRIWRMRGCSGFRYTDASLSVMLWRGRRRGK